MSLYRVIGGACALASLMSSAMGDDTPSNSGVKPTELIAIPLRRVQGSAGGSTSVQRRYFRSNILGIYGAAYLAELSVGTSAQPQKVDVLLDTGSFELWVNPDCAKSNEPNFCRSFGQYDPTKSSTAKNLGQPYTIQYGSGSTSGVYYTDDINFSGAKITGQQFGVANTSDAVWFGIMGLARGRGNGFINYNTIVDSVVAQGYANSRLFSMDLGSQGQPAGLTSGQIVFGGVDTSKYAGSLIKMAIDSGNPHYTVKLNNLDHRPPGATTASPVIILPGPITLIVDSGTTLSLLPRYLVDALSAQFPGAATDNRGGYTVPCSYQQQSGTVSFSLSATSFGGQSLPVSPVITVNVPYSEFIWNAGGNVCYLGAWSDDSVGVYILGDTFLRGAYVVFDQDSNALYMADYSRCSGPGAAGSNLVSVPAGRDAVLSITGTCALAAGAGGSGSSSAVDPAPSTTGSNPSVTLAGGPVPSSSLGGSAGPTVNPVGPVSVSSSIPAAANPSSSAAPVPNSATAAGTPTTALGASQGASSPPVAAPPTSTPFSGPALDPNAVPADGSGAISAGPTITGGSGSGSGSGSGDGNDPNVNPNLAPGAGAAATGGTMNGTITSTITNLIVYTVTACPSNAGTACVTGQLATRTNVYVTTICPTTTPAPQGGAGVVVTVKEQCRTLIYAVTSCPADDSSCTVGMTTTQTYTEYRTVTTTTATARQTTIQTVTAGGSNNNNSPVNGNGNGGIVGGNNGYSSSGTVVPPGVQGAGGSVGASPYDSSSSSQSGRGSNSSSSSGGNGSNGANGSNGENGNSGTNGSNGSSGTNGINGAAAAACAGTNCTVVAQGSVPTTTMPVYAGAERRMGAVRRWWVAVGIGSWVLALGAL